MSRSDDLQHDNGIRTSHRKTCPRRHCPRFEECKLDEWTSAEYWRSMCPTLTVVATANEDAPSSSSSRDVSDSEGPTPRTRPPLFSTLEECRRLGPRRKESLRTNGYAAVREGFLLDNHDERSLIDRLRDGIEQLSSEAIPPSFIFLYDEAWELAILSSSRVLSPSTHAKNQFNFDLLAWHIGPAGCEDDGDASSAATGASSGFSPHRDRQPENVSASFHHDDGEGGDDAKFVTHWVALTEAMPENSCLFMIPRHVDPGYDLGDDDNDDEDDEKEAKSNGCGPLYRALNTKESFQHIRAFPCRPGQGVLFTHRIAHWGSARDADTDLPARIALSFVCSDPSFEAPYLVNSDEWVNSTTGVLERAPPFQVRLLLVCAQLLIYHQRLRLSRQTLQNCYEYCKRHEDQLEASYKRKVFVEFVSAMKECAQQRDEPTPNGDDNDENEDDDEDEEAMMEEMLNAEAEGYGEFQDDYDDLEDEEGDNDKSTDEKLRVRPTKKARS